MASPEAADLQVDFLHGYHGDGYPFDGAGGAVGHAFFPSDPARAGGVHLDAEEEWAFRQPGEAMLRKQWFSTWPGWAFPKLNSTPSLYTLPLLWRVRHIKGHPKPG